jgi:glycine oxidase
VAKAQSTLECSVVGAGLIGLATAFELAQAGARVRVYDRAEPARAASWAGAGMLAPHTENIEDDVLRAQCIESLAMYPAFVERVTAASGVDARLRLDGIVTAFFDEPHAQEAMRRADALRATGIACEFLGRDATLLAEPFLGKHVLGALVVSHEGYVDNRRLGRALVAACESVGVTIASGVRDLAVECDDRRVLGVRTDRGFAPASHVIVAAGSLSALVPGIPVRNLPKVTPVKGQMLALGVPDGFVRHTTWIPGAYLVPREDGRLLVGATVEHVGFDERVTAHGIRQLLDAALSAAPSLSDFAVTETWAGLRPGTEDGRPVVGESDIKGLVYATGHYRNGILLTPWTARAVTQLVAKA